VSAAARVALAALALAAGAPGAQEAGARLTIAVLPFQLVDFTTASNPLTMRAQLGGLALEGVLADQLAASGRYTVVEGGRGAAGASPHADGAGTGGDASPCHEAPCIARVARALGAERAVAGRVARVSNIIWHVSLALVDVPAERVRHVEQEIEVKGDVPDLMPKVMALLARRLVAHETPAGASGGRGDGSGQGDAQGAARRRLTREEVARVLAAARDDAPADLRNTDLGGLDLAGLDFRRADLSGCRLAGARLTRAAMFGVTLSGCDAAGADLTGAVLDVAVLRGTDLSRAVLRDASLYATILIGANLTEADLSGARIIAAAGDVRLTRARLVGAKLGADPGNQPMGVMRTDLTGADLSGADLSGADLRKANLTRADLTAANLADADLAGAELAGAVLRDVRGRDRIRNLDRAKGVERAVGWVP
jgi:uncharacterized protein YjbI with pentapeptide repeats